MDFKLSHSSCVSCLSSPWQKASWRSVCTAEKRCSSGQHHVKNQQQASRLNQQKALLPAGMKIPKNLSSCHQSFSLHDLQLYFCERTYCTLVFICRFIALFIYLPASVQSLETKLMLLCRLQHTEIN